MYQKLSDCISVLNCVLCDLGPEPNLTFWHHFSNIDMGRHVSCEDCRGRVNGGYDPETCQVSNNYFEKFSLIDLSLLYNFSQCDEIPVARVQVKK